LSLPFPGYLPSEDEPAAVLPSEDYEIDRIIDQYNESNGRSRKTWYLVHWAGYPEDSVSWVLQEDVKAIAVVKEWKKMVRKFPAMRKKALNVLPSKRPLRYRGDDPVQNDETDS
jgi:hypothetical protein